MYVYTLTLEEAAPALFMIWLSEWAYIHLTKGVKYT